MDAYFAPSQIGGLAYLAPSDPATLQPLPSGTIDSQPAPSGQSQRFVLTTANATTGVYTLIGQDSAPNIGPTAFTITANAADFTVTGINPASYLPRITLTGPYGTVNIDGALFSIVGVSGGGSAGGGAPAPTVTGVTVIPSAATGSTQFSATVQGANSPSQGVTWSKSGAGTIDANGTYTAPAQTQAVQTATVTATSTTDPTKSNSASVTIAALNTPVPTVTSVSVSPTTASVQGGATQQFIAQATGTNNPPQTFDWTTTLGSIVNGLLTAPAATQAIQTGTITATSTIGQGVTGTATFTVPVAPYVGEAPYIVFLTTALL